MMENDDKCMLYQNLFLFFLLDDRLSIVYINSFKLEYLLSYTFFCDFKFGRCQTLENWKNFK